MHADKKMFCLIREYPRASAWIPVEAVASLVLLLCLLVSPSLHAQVSPAGSWRTLHSQHFRIHFRPGTDSIALHAVDEAERAYFLLATELVEPRQTIDLILSDAADFSNGAATIFPTNRITLLLVPPTSEPDLQNYDDWLRTVLVHELTHVFHLDRVEGPWRVVQSLLGRVPGAFPNLYQPSWVTEGIATYYESRFTNRGRVRGSFHTEVMLSLAGSDRWPRPSAATYISEKWPDGIAPYAFGSRFFDYLARTAGDSSVPRYIERTAGQWIPFRTGRPLRLATGLRRDSLWYAQASEYEERAHGRPPSDAEVIVRGLRLAPSPAVADDGSLAWFESSLDDAGTIVIRRPDGKERRHLTTGGVDLAWSGDTLYATWLELPDPDTYRSDLHRLVDGEWHQLTHGARLTDVGASLHGAVAVQVDADGNRVVRFFEDSILPLPEYEPGVTYGSPTVDSVGRVVTVEHSASGYLLRGIGRLDDPVLLRAGPNEVLADVTWDREGYQLYFVSDRSGVPQIYRLVPGAPLEQVTDQPFGARQPALNRDGWLYFSSLESDGYALKRVKLGPRPLPDAENKLASEDTARQASRLPDRVPPGGPVRLTGYSWWSALRPHYFIPYLVDKGSAGYFLGAFTTGFDPLGRFSYSLRGAGNLSSGRMDAAVYLTYRRWNHHSVDLYLAQDNGDAGLVATPETVAVRSRERDVELGINTIWRRWYRSVTFRVAGDYEEDRFSSDPQLDFITPRFVAASAGLTLGSTLRPPLAISDEDGAVLSVRYRRRWRLDRDGGSDEWRARMALYRSIKGIGGFAHPVVASRVSAATSAGVNRETFGVGGASGITYQPLPGIVVGSSRSFPVRGFEPGEIRGRTVAVGTAELRIPVALVAKPLWDLPYGLDRVSLRIFYDYGRAWEPPVSGLPEWIHSTGVEVTWDLLVLYDVPLRLRTGVATALNDGSVTRQGDVRFGLGIGSEF
jgi:hypothetical protein